MTNQEILTKAIQKAIDGGWKEQGIKWMFQLHELADMGDFDMSNPNNFNVLIFNHDFAKALWGTELIWNYELPSETTAVLTNGQIFQRAECWQYHLMQMVIAADPLEYLGEHLNG